MALRTPPSWLQNGSHPAENDRLTMQALVNSTGIVGLTAVPTSLQVTQNSPAGMSVLINTGYAAIVGTTQTNMGVYIAYNDASTVATITTANPSNPRIDRICLTINDAYYTGSLNNVSINVVAGTAAASPVAPATPANSISLATIAVGAGVTSILTANITDTRTETTSLLPSGVTASSTTTFTNKTIDTAGPNIIKIAGVSLTATTGTGSVVLGTSPTLTTPVISSITNTGTLTLPTTSDTLVGRTTTDTLTNKTVTAPLETYYTTATGFAGYTYYATTNGGVQYITGNSTANGTLNITSTSGQTLNTLMATNQTLSVVLLVTNGASAFYPTAYQIDGSAVTPKWSGGTAPSAGNASAIDAYSFIIIKTGAATFTVLGSQVKFA